MIANPVELFAHLHTLKCKLLITVGVFRKNTNYTKFRSNYIIFFYFYINNLYMPFNLFFFFFFFKYGRQNIENVRKQAHPALINRLDSEDERNISTVSDVSGENRAGSDTVDSKDQETSEITNQPNAEFKKPLPPSNPEYKPVKRKAHKKHNSNGNTVISRDDALILVPDGVQSSDGFTFIRTPRGSDNENSDTEVCIPFNFLIEAFGNFNLIHFRRIIPLIFI